MRFTRTFLTILFSFGATVNAAEIVAFHGLNQSVRSDANPGPEACSAPLVNFESHQFIENTLPSLAKAFEIGADIGHFNIRRTGDGHLVAFHDGWLSCRTNGSGLVKESNLVDLKKLDVGYGYSPLGCDRDKPNLKCFPLRGLGWGLMPTLEEILKEFPGHPFAINDKDGDKETIALLKKALSGLKPESVKKLIYVGDAVNIVRQEIPSMQVVSSRDETMSCLRVPADPRTDCRGKLFALPLSYARQGQRDLASILSELHAQNSRILVFNVDSKSDVDFVRGFKFDLIGTYRIDQTISDLKK